MQTVIKQCDSKLENETCEKMLYFDFILGLSLTIPEGAIGRNQTEEIFVAALREDKERPALLGKGSSI